MRHLILVLFFLIPSPVWAQSDQDDGLLWVALNLVDALEPGQPVIESDWTIPCSEQNTLDPLPHGFSLEHADRELPNELCESALDVRVGGWINDQFVFCRTLWWQPGQDGTNMIGIPREGTRTVKIVLPEKIQIGQEVYQAPEQILLRPTGVERIVEIDVELRRLPSVDLVVDAEHADPRELLDARAIWVTDSRAFLDLDLFTIRAPRGFALEAEATDRFGLTRSITPAVRPAVYVDLYGYYGWSFQVRVVPKHPEHTAKR